MRQLIENISTRLKIATVALPIRSFSISPNWGGSNASSRKRLTTWPGDSPTGSAWAPGCMRMRFSTFFCNSVRETSANGRLVVGKPYKPIARARPQPTRPATIVHKFQPVGASLLIRLKNSRVSRPGINQPAIRIIIEARFTSHSFGR